MTAASDQHPNRTIWPAPGDRIATRWRGARASLRARLLLLVICAALVPVGIVGWWITATASSSGEALLRSRLRESLNTLAIGTLREWSLHRSALLDIADDPAVQRVLATGSIDPAAMARLEERGKRLPTGVVDLELWSGGALVARLPNAENVQHVGGTFWTTLPISSRTGREDIGSLRIRLAAEHFFQNLPPTGWTGSMIVGAFERESGASLLPVPIDVPALQAGRFRLVGEEWIVERRMLAEPEIDLVAIAPLTPFTAPVREAARRGLWILLAVTAATIAAALFLASRMTSSLADLAKTAEGLRSGDLRRRATVAGEDEIGRVGAAFNEMAASLEATLEQLAQRESLAAVGQFATELSHEIRTPLTALRIDLQIIEERIADAAVRPVLTAALEEVDRLDRTVAGALSLARSGKVPLRTLDLRLPVRAAIHAAQPIIARSGATLECRLGDEPMPIAGDAGSLQQLVLNLLVNAAQAVYPGGRIEIEAGGAPRTRWLLVRDDGHGIPAEDLPRVLEPFFSTREEGTGLGLGIADRIVRAHRGTLSIESTPGAGTTIVVELPADIEETSSGAQPPATRDSGGNPIT